MLFISVIIIIIIIKINIIVIISVMIITIIKSQFMSGLSHRGEELPSGSGLFVTAESFVRYSVTDVLRFPKAPVRVLLTCCHSDCPSRSRNKM